MSAAVVVPTRDRPLYLDVALASIAPQAARAGAELLVVLDGPDPLSAAVAGAHGARVVAHDQPRGLNAARNIALDATDAALLCFVDDDVEVAPGWLDALLAADAAADARVGVLTGPVHARFEDHAVRACGREGPPITFQDLPPGRAWAPHAWGANMAVRRAGVALAGRFDATRPLYGDEQEWQARLHAAGGRIAWVPAARVVHRRAGDDARLGALCRAAHARGVASRRFDVAMARAPRLREELRVLAGCAVHPVRRRCLNGVVLAAHALGRTREALDPAPPPAVPGRDDFLSGVSGTVGGWRVPVLRAADRLQDLRTARRRRALASLAGAPGRGRHRVLVIGVERPGRRGDAIRAELCRSRHEVTVDTSPLREGLGKFAHLNALLARHDLAEVDWLLACDDDVTLPRGFLDAFLLLCDQHAFRLAQPAHRRHSHAAWPHTRRRGAAARRTTLVEIGPVTAFHRDTFAALLPFPERVGMGWGLDAHWAAVAREHGWPMGIVDATPVGHLDAPAGAGYGREQAMADARAFLAGRPYVTRDEVR